MRKETKTEIYFFYIGTQHANEHMNHLEYLNEEMKIEMILW